MNKKEIAIVAIIVLIISLSLSLSVSLLKEWRAFFLTILAVSIMIAGNLAAKKASAHLLDSEIEIKVWEAKYKFTHRNVQKHSIPIGAILPLLSKMILFPFQNFIWMASLVFDVKPRIYRGAKRFGLYTFSEVTEYHMGLIAASGIAVNLIFAVAGYFLGFSQFAALNIYYAFFSILPISELDGNKVFFGSKVLWSFLASIILIGMLLAMFII